MLLTAMLLVLASAGLHALWNALLKRARNPQAASVGVLGVAILATGCILPWVPGPILPGPGAWAWALAAGVGEGCYFVALGRALQAAPLGWSYAWMRGLAMLLVWPVSILLLGEPIQPLAALSVAVVCLGLGCMGLVSARGQGPRGIRWAVVTGVFIAGYTLCYKAALVHGAHPAGLFETAMLVALPIQLGVRIQRRGLREGLRPPGQWGLLGAAGILCAASFLLYLKALAMEGAGAMATLRNTSIVFALLLSRAMGERPTARQWAGAALVAAGAAGLAWR